MTKENALREAVREIEKAKQEKRPTNLYGANLQGVNLSGINFYNADLRDADLTNANCRDASFYSANLSGADLSGAALSGADLSGAVLSYVNLNDSNLDGANFGHANLQHTNFKNANLRNTVLDPFAPIPYPSNNDIVRLGLKLDTLNGRDIVLGWRTAESQVVLGHEYIWGWYGAPVFSVDIFTECHPGIHLASHEWVLYTYPNAEIVPVWCYRDEMIVADSKARAKWVCVGRPGETE